MGSTFLGEEGGEGTLDEEAAVGRLLAKLVASVVSPCPLTIQSMNLLAKFGTTFIERTRAESHKRTCITLTYICVTLAKKRKHLFFSRKL